MKLKLNASCTLRAFAATTGSRVTAVFCISRKDFCLVLKASVCMGVYACTYRRYSHDIRTGCTRRPELLLNCWSSTHLTRRRQGALRIMCSATSPASVQVALVIREYGHLRSGRMRLRTYWRGLKQPEKSAHMRRVQLCTDIDPFEEVEKDINLLPGVDIADLSDYLVYARNFVPQRSS